VEAREFEVGAVDGAAVERSQEVVQEPLARRRVIEDIADQRRLRRLSTKLRNRSQFCSKPWRKNA
jgi:hypothetical protein